MGVEKSETSSIQGRPVIHSSHLHSQDFTSSSSKIKGQAHETYLTRGSSHNKTRAGLELYWCEKAAATLHPHIWMNRPCQWKCTTCTDITCTYLRTFNFTWTAPGLSLICAPTQKVPDLSEESFCCSIKLTAQFNQWTLNAAVPFFNI